MIKPPINGNKMAACIEDTSPATRFTRQTPPRYIDEYDSDEGDNESNDLERELFAAVKSGRLKEVQELIRSGVDVNCRDAVPKTLASFSYHTPIFYAKEEQIITELLQAGANVNAQNEDGDSVLHTYIKSSLNADAISTLIKAGANVNCLNFKAERPIHFAMRSDAVVLQLLLDHGADINARDIEGNTPLIWIAQRSMSKHFCYELVTNCKQTPVDINENGMEHYQVQPIRLSQQDTVETRPESRNIFGVSARFGWLTVTLTVNDRFSTITEPELQALLSSNVSIDNYGNTFVHYLMRYYFTKVTDVKQQITILNLIKQADHFMDVRNIFGFTPVTGAVRKMNTGVGAMTGTMFQLLHTFSKDTKRLQQILSAGNFLGQNLWHLAVHNRFLFGKFLTACDQLIATLESESDAQTKFRINEIIHQSLNAVDVHGRTPLHYVAIRNSHVVLDRMLFSVNAADSLGRTPLHYAAFRGELYAKLTQVGADETLRDVNGLTPKQLKEICDLFRSEYNNKLSKAESLGERMRKMTDRLSDYVASTHSSSESDDDPPTRDDSIIHEMWENVVLASHESITAHVKKKLISLMNHLTDFISKEDPRFKCRPMLVGSEFEETKLESPDEFDFNIILVNFSNMIQVQESATCPHGFVHLRRSNAKSHYECLYERLDYGYFFNENGYFLTRRIKVEFMALVERAFYSDKFWCGIFADIHFLCSMDTVTTFKDPFGENNVVTLRLLLTSLSEDGMCFPFPIDVDITPVICVPDWLPNRMRIPSNLPFAPRNCYFILKNPQAYYAWIPYHEESNNSFARITFSTMESEMIRSSPMSCKAAYIIAKLMCCRTWKTQEGTTDHVFRTYAIKTAYMTCFSTEEDLFKRSAAMHNTVDGILMRLCLQKIFELLFQYAIQDFVPFFFIPECQLPVFSSEKFLKYFHMQSHLNGKEDQLEDRYDKKLTQCLQLMSIALEPPEGLLCQLQNIIVNPIT